MFLEVSEVIDYVTSEPQPGRAKISTPRSRRGKPGDIELGFDGDSSRFINLVTENFDNDKFLAFEAPEEEDLEITEGVAIIEEGEGWTQGKL